MIRRGIFLPSRRYFAWSAIAIVAIMSMALVAWAKSAGLPTRSPWAAVAVMIGAASCAAIVGAIDALKRIEASGWSFEEPRWSRWIVFYGVWALVGLGIGIGRAVVLQMGFGLSFAPGRLAFELLICMYMAVLLAFTLENQTMFLRVAARKQESSRRAVRFLFETREAFVRTSELRRHEALSILERQVEPELRAIQEGVVRMRAGRMAEHELAAMVEKLDHLRDTEIRLVSHLLHPSIIDMGLVPALRALARNRDDAMPIRLEAEPGTVEGLSPAASLQLYRIVEDALELACSQSAREVQISLAPAEGDRLLLAIALLGTGLDLAQARAIGDQALLDARVALLRGESRLEREGEDRIVMRIACPAEGT